MELENVKTGNKGINGDKVEQKIQEQELILKNLETKANELQEEAKEKLTQGDKARAKRALNLGRIYDEQITKRKVIK